jgi:hypothetical protein
MKLWRRASERTEHVDYSGAVAAIRTRRAVREAKGAFGCVPTVVADIFAYKPKERLAERDAQARRLIENARDIPRTWEPEQPMPKPLGVVAIILQFCAYAAVILGSVALVVIICINPDFAAALFHRFARLWPWLTR